jgi:hypothetical protein
VLVIVNVTAANANRSNLYKHFIGVELRNINLTNGNFALF